MPYGRPSVPSSYGWKHEKIGGHGAVWAGRPGNGVSTFYGLRSAQEVEEATQKVRDGIAKGELDTEASYVTRWNTEAKRAEVVGSVPTTPARSYSSSHLPAPHATMDRSLAELLPRNRRS